MGANVDAIESERVTRIERGGERGGGFILSLQAEVDVREY